MRRLGDWLAGVLIAAMSKAQTPRPPGYYSQQSRDQDSDIQRRTDAAQYADWIARKRRGEVQ